MRFLQNIFQSNCRSQNTSGISGHVSRLGRSPQICKSKPRIIGNPLPYSPGPRDEQPAGKGCFGVCTQFYSNEYGTDQKARSFIKKEIINPGEHGSENPEILAEIAKLNHPNIVQYVHLEKKDGPIIMRDAGQTLFKLKHQPIPRKWFNNKLRFYKLRFYEELTIYLQLLKGVQVLHHSRIHHRDLIDGNIAIQKDGTVKIIDFGWAAASETFNTDDMIFLEKQNKFFYAYSDITRLKLRLNLILENYKKITRSGNIKEREHYKILSDFAQSGHFDLSDLISKLEEMRDCFPKWGNESIPSTTDFENVHALQERFRAKPSSTGWKRRIAHIGIVKKARQFFHLGRS